MYFCTEGMDLLMASPENEGEIAFTAAAVRLVIGVPAPVSFAVLLTPEVLARARGAGPDALRARRVEHHPGLRLRRRRDDEHRATRVAYRPFGDGTQQQAFHALGVVGADDDQVCAEIRGQLNDPVCRRIDH